MKLAFTTIGCPGWNMDTIIARAVEYGYSGVDFRGYLGELHLYVLPEFSTRAQETARRFADVGLDIPCLSSSAHFFAPDAGAFGPHIEELRRYAGLCADFGAQYVRIFGGKIGNMPRERAVDIAAENLRRMASVARENGIVILAETHDDWVNSVHLKAVFEIADSRSLGILWDTHHPYRMSGEAPEQTCARLGPWIQYTHWKDSRAGDKGFKPCMFGAGDIPLAEIYSVLKRAGYEGYYTLEWEKLWHKDIEEPEVVFPEFVRVMKDIAFQKDKNDSFSG